MNNLILKKTSLLMIDDEGFVAFCWLIDCRLIVQSPSTGVYPAFNVLICHLLGYPLVPIKKPTPMNVSSWGIQTDEHLYHRTAGKQNFTLDTCTHCLCIVYAHDHYPFTEGNNTREIVAHAFYTLSIRSNKGWPLVLLFSKLSILFCGCFDPENTFPDNENA